jgi:uncharacterized protein (UPF0371 family)
MHIKIDGKVYWDFNTFKVYKRFYCKKILPSDSNNRIDMLNWMTNDLENSQVAKETLENI